MTATLTSRYAAPVAVSSDSYLSYSRISLYQSCPLRYYFKYVAGLPERTVSTSLIFGSAVHRAAQFHFEELLAGNEPPCLDALIAEYDRHWQEVDPQLVQFGKDEDIESLAPWRVACWLRLRLVRSPTPQGKSLASKKNSCEAR